MRFRKTRFRRSKSFSRFRRRGSTFRRRGARSRRGTRRFMLIGNRM